MSNEDGYHVVGIAKTRQHGGNKVIKLSTGHRAYLAAVSASIIDEATSKVQYPDVPTYYIEQKDKHEPNPNDESYIKACAEVDQKRALAGVDAMIMFGLELIDEDDQPLVIESGRWLKRLQLLERMGNISLSVFDLDSEVDLEFLYKKYVAVAATDIGKIAAASGVSEEDVEQAQESFRGDETQF